MVSEDLQKRLLDAVGNGGFIPESSTIPVTSLSNFVGGQQDRSNYTNGFGGHWDGSKFYNGFGITKNHQIIDYWMLRRRSKQLFTENLYARGLIRRLITNEINTGLALEATPDAEILGLDRDDLAAWSENIERRYSIYGKNPEICDFNKVKTMGAIQRQARMMALVSGDVLVILRTGSNGLPNIELIDADHVTDPFSDTMIRAVRNRGNKLVHGVEINKRKQHVAYFVLQDNGIHKRVPAYGSRTGRKQAWLLYGTEKLISEVRGQSILAIVMQSLKEIDRYRDSELRAAVVNSMIAVWIEKGENKVSSLPISGGAARRDVVETQNDRHGRSDVEFSSSLPGMAYQELQQGEKINSFDTKRPNANYAEFEAAILHSFAWANEIPPEILLLAFSSNYAAARGAVNELKMYLDKARTCFGEEFNDIIYKDFVISEVLRRNIIAPGLLASLINQEQWDIQGAWLLASWAGAIKPSSDFLKDVKAYKELVNESWITRDRATRELTGMKFSKVVQQLKMENASHAEAIKPLVDAGLIKDENEAIENNDQSNDDQATN